MTRIIKAIATLGLFVLLTPALFLIVAIEVAHASYKTNTWPWKFTGLW